MDVAIDEENAERKTKEKRKKTEEKD